MKYSIPKSGDPLDGNGPVWIYPRKGPVAQQPVTPVLERSLKYFPGNADSSSRGGKRTKRTAKGGQA